MEYSMVHIAPDQWQIYKKLQLSMAQEEEKLYPGSFLQECSISEHAWQARVADLMHPLLFAQFHQEYVGMVGARSISPLIARIVSLYVMPSDRRKGIASALLQAMLIQLQQKAYAKVELLVHQDARAAHILYDHFGFEHVRTVVSMSGGNSIAQVLLSRFL